MRNFLLMRSFKHIWETFEKSEELDGLSIPLVMQLPSLDKGLPLPLLRSISKNAQLHALTNPKQFHGF